MVHSSVEWYTVQWNGTQFNVMVHSSVEQYTVQHGAFGCRVDWNVNQNWERHTERCQNFCGCFAECAGHLFLSSENQNRKGNVASGLRLSVDRCLH